MRRSLAARGVRRATWLVAVLALQPLFDVAVASDYALDFSKNLNVWAWDHALGWNHTFGSGLALSADATHARKVSDIAFGLSRESRTTGGNAALDYAISPTLSVGGTFELFHSRLRSGGVVATVASERVSAVSTYRPLPEITLRQSVGGAHDARRGVSNAGPAYDVSANISPFRRAFGGRGPRLSVSYNRNAVLSRQGDMKGEFALDASYSAGERISQRVYVRDRREEQKYVGQSAGGQILGRRTASRMFGASATAGSGWVGDIEASAEYRTGDVEDDASDDPAHLKYKTDNTTRAWSLGLEWTAPIREPLLSYTVSASENRRDADPIERLVPGSEDSTTELPNQLDRRQKSLSMSVASSFFVGPSDSVAMVGTMSISRDHTPSADEVNDRDDFSRSIMGTYRHTFRQGSFVELRMERAERHRVWLNRQRSANNRWERALNFWATTSANLGILALTQRAFFRTEQEEFDFDYLTPDEPRSRNTRLARLVFDGVLPWARRGELSLSYSAEARTRGTLLPADEPGQRPTIWQLTSNSLAHVVRLALGAPLGREWRLAPAVSFSRRREYRPTQARWNPFRLGVELDKQEALEVEAGLTYRPTHGALGGNDVLSISVSRVYRRRTTFSDRRSYLSMAYQHMF